MKGERARIAAVVLVVTAIGALGTIVLARTPPGAAASAVVYGGFSPGDLDATFGSGGKVTTDFGSQGGETARALAIQPNGKIVAAGTANQGGAVAFALARYLPDGTLDPVFGGDGTVTTEFAGNDWILGLAIQGDGRIVAGGYTAGGDDFALARYKRNGELDGSFDGDGIVTTDLGGVGFGQDLVIQPDGKIILVGGNNSDLALLRYNTDGSLDGSFGTGGSVTTDLGDSEYLVGVALQADGGIVVAGRFGSSPSDFIIARYAPDGTLDTSFGGDGTVTVDFSGGDDRAGDLAIQADGKIVLVGSTSLSGDPNQTDFALARVNPDGSPDTPIDRFLDAPFGANGRVVTDFSGDADEAYAVTIDASGKIIVAGHSIGAGNNHEFALARYDVSGALDPAFGTWGRVLTDFSPWDYAHDVAIQGDGRIVVAGTGANDFALARHHAAPCCTIGGQP